jgi:hypothetical protein
MPNPQSLTEILRIRTEQRQTQQRHYSISSFNPKVAASCTQWEWDGHGPVRRLVA